MALGEPTATLIPRFVGSSKGRGTSLTLDAWIAWKHADAEWRATRLYRATTAGVIIAFLGLIVALIAAVEG